MHMLASSSHTSTGTTALKAIPLFGAGLVGIVAGGTLWGFLGVGSVLLAICTVTHALDSAQRTHEIEQLYARSGKLIPTPVHVSPRAAASDFRSVHR
jgi:hypothetical protein